MLALPVPPSRCQWYVVGGYMDWFGNITAERVLSNSTDKWNYPALYHTFTVPCSEEGETLQIIMARARATTGAIQPLY